MADVKVVIPLVKVVYFLLLKILARYLLPGIEKFQQINVLQIVCRCGLSTTKRFRLTTPNRRRSKTTKRRTTTSTRTTLRRRRNFNGEMTAFFSVTLLGPGPMLQNFFVCNLQIFVLNYCLSLASFSNLV
jgi:hypothetical protein